MSSERLAILLEFISFFLVTLDLIGKNRLERWYLRSLKWLENILEGGMISFFRRDVANWLTGKWTRWSYYIIVTYGLILCIPLSLHYIQNDDLLHVLWLLFLHVYLFIGSFLVYISAPLWIFLMRVLIGNLLRLLNKHKMEGVMLGFGTVLFVISKVISFLQAD